MENALLVQLYCVKQTHLWICFVQFFHSGYAVSAKPSCSVTERCTCMSTHFGWDRGWTDISLSLFSNTYSVTLPVLPCAQIKLKNNNIWERSVGSRWNLSSVPGRKPVREQWEDESLFQCGIATDPICCIWISMNHQSSLTLSLSWLAYFLCEQSELFTLCPGYELQLASTSSLDRQQWRGSGLKGTKSPVFKVKAGSWIKRVNAWVLYSDK